MYCAIKKFNKLTYNRRESGGFFLKVIEYTVLRAECINLK